jgi:hypothetical protein
MFESTPKKKHINSDREIDQRLAGYLEELHSTQDTWFREGSFQNINGRMHLISKALDECRKVLYIEHGHEWGTREMHVSSVSLALSEEYGHLSSMKEGFAQKKEIEKQRELPKHRIQGAVNPYQTEPVPQRTAVKEHTWDYLGADFQRSKKKQVSWNSNDTCHNCGSPISETKGHWFDRGDDFMCPDGEQEHSPSREHDK